MARDFDIVVYGATGFTGRQAAQQIAKHAPEGLRWAIAGRNAGKLEAVRKLLAQDGADPGVVVADSTDPVTVDAMAASTRVLLTTAGPYAKYGTPVVEACVKHGTHYCDITGETPWVHSLIQSFHEQAKASGTRIVPFCGFDSVPSDLGTFMVARFAQETLGEDLVEVRSVFSGKGGFNGGTLDSALNMAETKQGRKLYDVLLLNPKDHRSDAERERSSDPTSVKFDPDLKRWTGPFFMGPVNSRVVRRSNALFDAEGQGYGETFRYEERMSVPGRVRGYLMAGVMGLFAAGLSSKTGRSIIRKVAPAPGEGPSEEAMDQGQTGCRLVGVTASGKRVFGKIRYAGDPGNRATVLMLTQAALALAVDEDKLPKRAGVLTPATCFENVLLDRVRAAGMQWTVEAG